MNLSFKLYLLKIETLSFLHKKKNEKVFKSWKKHPLFFVLFFKRKFRKKIQNLQVFHQRKIEKLFV